MSNLGQQLLIPGRGAVSGGTKTLLRQTCQVAGAYANPSGGDVFLTANFAKPLLLGSYVIIVMVISGNSHGADFGMVGPTTIPGGGPTHPSGGGQDIGIDSAGLNASCDILWWKVSATEAGSTTITFGVGITTGTNYGACWAGEYLQPDVSAYGYYNGSDGAQPIDASDAWSGTAQNVALTRGVGQTSNYTPEAVLWGLGVLGPETINSHDRTQEGWVTDGANVGLLVVDTYVNAVGVYNAQAVLSASQNYVAANLTWKTLIFPS